MHNLASGLPLQCNAMPYTIYNKKIKIYIYTYIIFILKCVGSVGEADYSGCGLVLARVVGVMASLNPVEWKGAIEKIVTCLRSEFQINFLL